MEIAHFDQGCVGHVRRKPTTRNARPVSKWRAGGECIGVSTVPKLIPYQLILLDNLRRDRPDAGSCKVSAGRVTFPTTREVRSQEGLMGSEVLEVIPVEEEEDGARGEGEEGLEVLDAKTRHDEFQPGDDEKKWDELIQQEGDVKVRQWTFAGS